MDDDAFYNWEDLVLEYDDFQRFGSFEDYNEFIGITLHDFGTQGNHEFYIELDLWLSDRGVQRIRDYLNNKGFDDIDQIGITDVSFSIDWETGAVEPDFNSFVPMIDGGGSVTTLSKTSMLNAFYAYIEAVGCDKLIDYLQKAVMQYEIPLLMREHTQGGEGWKGKEVEEMKANWEKNQASNLEHFISFFPEEYRKIKEPVEEEKEI